MKKYITIFFALAIVLTLFTGCIDDILGSRQNGQKTPKETTIDTAYPNDISCNGRRVITVETAENDLRSHNRLNEDLKQGVVSFREKWKHTGSAGRPTPVYVFDIVVQREYVAEYHTATVKYGLDEGNEFEYKSCEIDGVPSFKFTKFGTYQYNDGETSIWINFIERNNNLEIEYEIAYYAQYWSSGEWIACSSDGTTNGSGSIAWDGETYYLSIDLGDFIGGEDGEEKDRGSIKIYPDKGVYWYALHANGSPYKLSN